MGEDVDVFFFQAEDGIRDLTVTGVQTCALPISPGAVQRRLGAWVDHEFPVPRGGPVVIAFPPHVVALLRGRCLRQKLERLVTAACSAVPMNSRAWVTRARPCFEQGPVLPYTPRGYCSSCPLVGTVLGVPRTPRGSTGRAAFLCLRRRC